MINEDPRAHNYVFVVWTTARLRDHMEAETCISVSCLPPYCPMLNPIERFWGHMKDTAYANTLYKSMNDLLDKVNEVLSAQNTINQPLRLNFVA
ncbi:MAG: hypothetical protein F4136_09355 [Chloroflexi bacterium]|nr:hypothetical protein [Chloroflexota bacterium]